MFKQYVFNINRKRSSSNGSNFLSYLADLMCESFNIRTWSVNEFCDFPLRGWRNYLLVDQIHFYQLLRVLFINKSSKLLDFNLKSLKELNDKWMLILINWVHNFIFKYINTFIDKENRFYSDYWLCKLISLILIFKDCWIR